MDQVGKRKSFVRDVSKTYFTRKGGQEGYLADIKVSVERVRLTVSSEDDASTRLPERIELTISRRKRSTSFRVNEVKVLKDLIESALPFLEGAETVMKQEKEAWLAQQKAQRQYQPKGNPDFSMGRGKTERQRRKGKARAKRCEIDGNR